MYRKILVYLDGSASDQAVLHHARALARAFGATLHLFRHLELPIYPAVGLPAAGAYPVQYEQEREQVEEYLSQARATLTHEGITAEVHMVTGTAVEQAADVADDLSVDMVVLAEHLREGFQRWLLGSAAESMRRACHCPVLAVPPELKEQARPAFHTLQSAATGA